MPPDPNKNTGTSRAQAKLNQSVAMRSNADKLEESQAEDQTYKDKLSWKSGLGRFFGAVGLGAAAFLTGGSALVIAGAAGIGSRVGNELGEAHADKYDRPDDINVDDINYFKDDAKQINEDREQFDKDFDKNQWVDAGKDAWTAYNFANSASKYGAEVAGTAADGTTLFAKQTPLEGAKKFGGDTAEWGKKLGARWGKGAGEDAVKVIGKGAKTDSKGKVWNKGKALIGKAVDKKVQGKGLSPEALRRLDVSGAKEALNLFDKGKNAVKTGTNASQLIMNARGYAENNDSFEVNPDAFNATYNSPGSGQG